MIGSIWLLQSLQSIGLAAAADAAAELLDDAEAPSFPPDDVHPLVARARVRTAAPAVAARRREENMITPG
jgi:hypothetical protein